MSAVLSEASDDAERFAMAKVASRTSPVVEAKHMSWAELGAVLTRHKPGEKDGPGFMPAAIEPGPREGARVAHLSLLVLDVEAKAEVGQDGAKRVIGPRPPPLRALAAELELRDIAAVLATSYSHEAPAADGATLGPRYRVAIRPSRPIGPDELKPLGLHVASLLGLTGCFDAACLEPARLYYLPRCPDDRRHLVETARVNGQPLVVDEMLRAALAAKAPPARINDEPGGTVIAEFNAAHDVGAILEQHGYEPAGRNRWRWPQSTTGLAGVVLLPESDRIYSHHGADPLHGEHGHDAFSAWCVLRHGGDAKAAVREAARMLGMNRPQAVPGASAMGWPKLDPLPEATTPEPEPYPFRGLGEVLGLAAAAIARDVQAPDALAGGSVLAAAALAAQAHADVEMPHGDVAPLSLFIISAALSGDRKTGTDKVACGPIEEARKAQARAYAQAMQVYAADKAARPKSDAPEPPPAAQSLTIGKATTEGLHTMLKGQSHIGLFTGEGGELLGGHSLREERRVAGLAWLLKAWGGETLDDLTRGAGLSLLPGRRVSMHAMVQPVLLRQLLADPLASGQGLLARCLIAEPASLAGTRMFNNARAAESPDAKRYAERLALLLARKPRLHEAGDGFELQPRRLLMSKAATALWIEFYNEVERKQLPGEELCRAQAFGGKTGEHAARIAGVVELFNDPDAAEISVETMAGAIEVAAFYIGEHLRLTGASAEHQRLARLCALVEWFREQPGPVKTADLLQRTPRNIRMLKADGIKPLTDELAQRGYIRAVGNTWEVRHGLPA